MTINKDIQKLFNEYKTVENDRIFFNIIPVEENYYKDIAEKSQSNGAWTDEDIIKKYFTHDVRLKNNKETFELPYDYTIPYNKVCIISKYMLINFTHESENKIQVELIGKKNQEIINMILTENRTLVTDKTDMINTITFILSLFEKINETEKDYYQVYKEQCTLKNHRKNGENIRPVYIVLNKKATSVKSYQMNKKNPVEYAFSWIVRGHYRKISENSIGKNRWGIYTEQGKTWINTYVKGDRNLEPRQRQYIVK